MLERRPRPRVLFEAVPDDTFNAMKLFTPTHKRITTDEDPANIHDSDWDLLVSYADQPFSSGIPHILAIGSSHIGKFDRSNSVSAAELGIPGELDTGIAKLVRESIVPTLDQPPRQAWATYKPQWGGSHWGKSKLQNSDLGDGFPLLTAGEEEYVLAFWSISRQPFDEAPAHTVALPPNIKHPEAWLTALIRVLEPQDPDRFPPGLNWRDIDRWAPPDLRRANSNVERLRSLRDQTIRKLDTQIAEAELRVESTKKAAEQGWWKLLTSSGDELVQVVTEALEHLGFNVENRDRTTSSAKLEDLRVTDPTVPNWTCLTEVKGYTRGAKSNDAMQVAMNPSTNFAIEKHRKPDKFWHIVNAKRETPPDQRGKTFSNPTEVLASFTESNGLVIDTRDLLRSLFSVLDGATSPDQIRSELRESNGLWSFPIEPLVQ